MDELYEIFDVVDTPQEAVEQHNKREFLIDIIKQGKADKLAGKTAWTVKRVKKASDSVIDKLYNEFNNNEIKHKAENTGKAVSKHVVNLYSNGVSKVIKIDDVNALRRDIEEDPIIRDSMADVGALMVGTFGRFLAPMLVVAHTANHSQGLVSNIEEEEEKVDENIDG